MTETTTASTLRWGIIGTGMISEWFLTDLSLNQTKSKQIVTAIGSSSIAKGTNFAANWLTFNHGIKPAIQTYDEVYANPDVDIIYIGLPHSMHKDAVLKALKNGKHVLCEKPITVNKAEAQVIYDLAEEKGLFLMEGLWTKFFPIVIKLRDVLFNECKIGEVHHLSVNFSFDAKLDQLGDEARLKNPKFGAGALLDLGVYILTYARILLGGTDYEKSNDFTVKAVSDVKNGIDYATSIALQYADTKRQAVLNCSNYFKGPLQFARIDGSLGSILIYANAEKPNPAAPEKFVIQYFDPSKEDEVYEFRHPGWGLYYEADYCADVIAKGTDFNPEMHSHRESLLVMETMDKIRAQVGVVYPQDE